MTEKTKLADDKNQLLIEILSKGVFDKREISGLVNSLVADDSDGKCGCRDVCGCHSRCGSGCDRVTDPLQWVVQPADIVATVENILREKGLLR